MSGSHVVAAMAAVASGLLLASCSPGAQAGGGSWAAVPQIPDAAGASFASVAAGPDRFVVVGATPRSGQVGHAAAWASTDGRTWTAAADDPAFDERQMLAVAGGRAGFAAVGLTCDPQECGKNAMWTSTDGQTWQAAAAIPVASGLTAHSATIVAGGPGWIVGGYSYPGGNEPWPAGVWTTVDGSSWTASTVADPGTGPADVGGGDPPARGTVGGVIAGFALSDARMVAVGSVTTPTAHRAAAWTSTDAKTWTRSADSPSFEDGAMNAVAWDGKEFVAVGLDGSGAAVWTSADGATWDKAPAGPGFAGARLTSVSPGADGLVAVGYDGSGAHAWTSTDGKTWVGATGAADLAGSQALGVADKGGELVAIGAAVGRTGDLGQRPVARRVSQGFGLAR